MDLKIYGLERNPRLWLDSGQLTKSRDFHQNISSNTVGSCLKGQWFKILFLSEKWGRHAAANVNYEAGEKGETILERNEIWIKLWLLFESI